MTQAFKDVTPDYLSKFKALIMSKVKDGELTDDDCMAIMKSARGFAGAMGKKRKKEGEQMTAGEKSYNDIIEAVNAALREKYPSGNGDCQYYAMEVFPTYAIIREWAANKLYRVPYMVDGDSITFGTFEEVEETYVPVTAAEFIQSLDFAEHTGLMVAFWPDGEAAKALAVKGGEPAESLHMTLCYCGDVSQLGEVAVARAIVAVENIARYQPALTGMTGGIGRFNASKSSDGKDVVYASVDMPGLIEFRNRLSEALKGAGSPPRTDHGFTPHITLAYVEPEASMPVEKVPAQGLRFTTVSISVGDKRIDIPLGGERRGEYSDLADICADGREFRLFVEAAFAEPPEWMPLLPKPGEYKHPDYGKIKITRERNGTFINNFASAIYQSKLPINAEHKPSEEGALGWIIEMRQNNDDSVDARVNWTDLGEEAIKNDRFAYVSPEWFDSWTDNSGTKHKDIVSGAALTVRPFFKDSSMRPLIASERGLELCSPQGSTDDKQGTFYYMHFTAATPINNTEVKTMAETNPAKPEKDDAAEKRFADVESQLRTANETIATQTEALKTANETITKQGEAIVEMQRSARRVRFETTAKDFSGDRVKHVEMMEFIADNDEKGEESERLKAYIEQQRGTAAQLKDANLFTEVGHDAPGSVVSALDKMNAEAGKLMTENPKLTHAQAFSQVMDQQPKLYDEYLAEQGRAN